MGLDFNREQLLGILVTGILAVTATVVFNLIDADPQIAGTIVFAIIVIGGGLAADAGPETGQD